MRGALAVHAGLQLGQGIEPVGVTAMLADQHRRQGRLGKLAPIEWEMLHTRPRSGLTHHPVSQLKPRQSGTCHGKMLALASTLTRVRVRLRALARLWLGCAL